jgi:UDP-N-acetylglucosamine--N-acetylmuramyl-(pentapeptide) pyrophosphoryl-undecaprenol N-acetylglucosamine transferase
MIAAGGTGGHVFPALAAAEAALDLNPAVQLSYVDSVEDFARPLVERAALPFAHLDQVRAGPLNGVSLLKRVRSIFEIAIGTVQAWILVRRRHPDALLLTGGWVGLPVALAARLHGVPSLIYLPDIEPGLAIRRLQPLVHAVACTVADSRAYFPKNARVIVTGYPIRKAMRAATREQAQIHFQLDAQRPTLLVFGGSRGARTINHALLDGLPRLLAAGLQVIHVTGSTDWEALQKQIDGLRTQYDLGGYRAFPFLHEEMGLAMAASDLTVCRGGASALGELPAFGLPAIVVPYPYAWRYQKVNADWLAERGAALVLRDEDMADQLTDAILNLINDPTRLHSMREAARSLATPEGAASPDGARNLAQQLLEFAESRTQS